MPKYDENQEKYITQLGTSTAMLFVPITTKDVELTSKSHGSACLLHLRAGCAEVLRGRAQGQICARTNDIAEMLDIIRDGASFDFLFLYGTTLTKAPNNYFRFYTTDTANVASDFAALENSFLGVTRELSRKIRGTRQLINNTIINRRFESPVFVINLMNTIYNMIIL